jgi:hypothetical protein
MHLSDFGNFLAGFVAPLAFFWFILTYFQQGDELRLNTEALKLQQEELRSQVEQTRSLVREAEKQSTAATEMLVLERKQIEETRRKEKAWVQPLFQSLGGTASRGSAQIDFKNAGGTARRLVVEDTPGFQVHINPADVIESGGKGQFVVHALSNFPTRVRIEYSDEHDERYGMVIEFHTEGGFRQIEAGLATKRT